MYKAGLPAKSGVGGGLVAVSPGKMALAAFSPPWTRQGNTVRGAGSSSIHHQGIDLNLFRS